MSDLYETTLFVQYAHRLAQRLKPRDAAAAKLVDWTESVLLAHVRPDDDRPFRRRAEAVDPAVWDALRARLADAVAAARRVPPDALAANTAAFAAHVGLDADEAALFTLAVRAARNGPLKSLCDDLTDDCRLPVPEAAAHLTGLPVDRVRAMLAPRARLVASGLLVQERPTFHGLGLMPPVRLLVALEPPARGLHDTLERLFADPGAPDADWADFAHLGVARDFTRRLVAGALDRKATGVNILLHGAPGTGKTAFCRALAATVEARLHGVGETGDDGDEPSRGERLQMLRLGQRLLAGGGRSLILFDEMDDLFALPLAMFGMPHRGAVSRVHLHRLLETNPVPTLWTTNDIADCAPAILRRMTFTIGLRTPPQAVRARLWQRIGAREGLPLDPADCGALARDFAEAPALAATAVRGAVIAGGGKADVRLAVAALARAVRGGRAPVPEAQPGLPFDPALARADHDLAALSTRLIAAGPRSGALCLSGPPGTGKSTFARHLAEGLGMPVLERRASDLLGRYVGDSEKAIAAAFAEARETGAFLIFDEADSLLASRAGAQHRWELSQVNEMLTWMETHPLPMACTTNMADRLDPAAQRRFALRVAFLPLDPRQRAEAFRCFLGQAPPSGLDRLDLFTPGDFAVVSRRAAMLGLTATEALLAELAREQAGKPDARGPLGFRAA